MHVPGWHEKTRALREEGRVRMVGILQEQHPDRARLFMQWKGMDWPLMVDSLNLLEVEVVPITVLVDEAGIVRSIGAKPGELGAFLGSRAGGLEVSLIDPGGDEEEGASLRTRADAAFLWGCEPGLDRAIDLYGEALAIDPADARARFRLGVAHRARHDSGGRRSGDFARAVESWGTALDMEPNQYIWRRRIQQYGPRLSKPYSFYDWVAEARRAIEARGGEPVPLIVEPGGAEIAHPGGSPARSSPAAREPDPEGRIMRDEKGMIRIESTVVPARTAPGEPARIHIAMRPERKLEAHWNNEAEDLVVWLDPPAGWEIDTRLLTVAIPSRPVSRETRRVELEVKSPVDFTGTARLSGYALYYVCEDVDGTCLYRRQDLVVPIEVPSPPSR